MDSEVKVTPIFICPNDCDPIIFYQSGTVKTDRLFSEEGDILKDKGDYGFTPETEMKCRNCDAVAIKKTKKVTTTVVIE